MNPAANEVDAAAETPKGFINHIVKYFYASYKS